MRLIADRLASLPGRYVPWPLWALTIPAVILFALEPTASPWLRFDRVAILEGQLWRLVTGHFVHLGGVHLALNLVGVLLLVVGFWAPGQPPIGKTMIALLGLMLGVSFGLMLGSPEVDWYVGLSGILHGLVLLVAVWRLAGSMRLIMLAGLFGKLLWEQTIGSTSIAGASLGGAVIVDAHLYGALTALGLLAWPAMRANVAKTPA